MVDNLQEEEKKIQSVQSRTPKKIKSIKKRPLINIRKIDDNIRKGLNKLKNPNFFKRNNPQSIDKTISPIIDVRDKTSFVKEAALFSAPIGVITKFSKISKIPQVKTLGKLITQKSKEAGALFPTKQHAETLIRESLEKGKSIPGNIATLIIAKHPTAFTDVARKFLGGGSKITPTGKRGLQWGGEGQPIPIKEGAAAFTSKILKTKVKPLTMKEREALEFAPAFQQEKFLKTIKHGQKIDQKLVEKLDPIIARQFIEVKPITSKITSSVIGTGIASTILAPVLAPRTNKTPTRTSFMDPLPEFEIPKKPITTTDIKTPTPTLVEIPTPTPTPVEITTPTPTLVEIPTPTRTPVDITTPTPTPVEITTPTPTPVAITTPTPEIFPEPSPELPPPTPPPPPPSTPQKSYMEPLPPPPPPPSKPQKSYMGALPPFFGKSTDKKKIILPSDVSQLEQLKNKIPEDKNFPLKVQWKEKDQYITLNLNTGEKNIYYRPQLSGVNPGYTPEETIKIITRQKIRPKLLNTKSGNLMIKVISPNIVTLKRLNNLANLTKKRPLQFRQ